MALRLDWRESASSWFATVEADDPPESAVETIRELVHMLNRVRPTKLDRLKSSIRSTHGWHDIQGLEVRLEHTTDEESFVSIAIDGEQAIISWLSSHEHVFPQDSDGRRSWTSIVVDAVAAILRGEYEVEEVYRGQRLTKVRVRDKVRSGRIVSGTATIDALCPWPRRHTVTRCIDWEHRLEVSRAPAQLAFAAVHGPPSRAMVNMGAARRDRGG
ncbi:hypothetical protein BH23ACT12_BH23ACT12_04870 [soil metagenome]